MNDPRPRMDEAEAGLLTAWLREELDLQRELVSALDDIGGRIVAQDPEGLEEVLVEQNSTIERMEGISTRRQRMLGHLLVRVGLEASEGCVDRLITYAPTETRERLRALHHEVCECARRVRRLNNRNGMLIRQTLRMNENLVRSMFSADLGASTYTADGRTTTAADVILDRSI